MVGRLLLLRNTSWKQSGACAILAQRRVGQLTQAGAKRGKARSKVLRHQLPLQQCPDGEIGRRSGLKIRRPQGRGGSSPPLGTKIKSIALANLPRRDEVLKNVLALS